MAGRMVISKAKHRGMRCMFAMGSVFKAVEVAPSTSVSVLASTTPTVVKTSIIPHRGISQSRKKKIARNRCRHRRGLISSILRHYSSIHDSIARNFTHTFVHCHTFDTSTIVAYPSITMRRSYLSRLAGY